MPVWILVDEREPLLLRLVMPSMEKTLAGTVRRERNWLTLQ